MRELQDYQPTAPDITKAKKLLRKIEANRCLDTDSLLELLNASHEACDLHGPCKYSPTYDANCFCALVPAADVLSSLGRDPAQLARTVRHEN